MKPPFAQLLDPRESERALAAFCEQPLAIIRADPMLLTTTNRRQIRIAMVLVEPRHDVLDLIRAHAAGQDGDARYDWRFLLHPTEPSVAVLKARFTAPVRCTFTLTFDMHRHFGSLALAVQQGQLYLSADANNPAGTAIAFDHNAVASLAAPLLAFGMAQELMMQSRAREN